MDKVVEFPKKELSKEIRKGNKWVRIDVYGDDEGGWLLEIVDEYWNSTCWDEPFKSAQEAMNEGINAIENEGIESFIDYSPEPENN
jgi:uncharacterized protein